MTRYSRRSGLVVITLAGAVALAGCGGGSQPPAASDTTTSSTTTSTSSTSSSTSDTSTSSSTSTSTTTSATAGTSSTSEPSAPGDAAVTTGRLPAAEAARVVFPAAGFSKYDSPRDVAEHFAEDYIRFTDPRIGSFQRGDSRSGEVPVRPSRRGPVTTVLVRRMSDQRWYVIAATTPQIEITRPKAGSRITSPVRVTGRASAFEGNVLVQVRRGTAGKVLGQAPVTGRGDGVLGPYSGSVRFTNPGSGRGAMVYLIDSAKDGSIWQAAAIPIGFTR